MQSFNKIKVKKEEQQQNDIQYAPQFQNQQHSKQQKQSILQEIQSHINPSQINQSVKQQSLRSDIIQQLQSSATFVHHKTNNNKISSIQRSLDLDRAKSKDKESASDKKNDKNMNKQIQNKQSYLQNLDLEITRLKYKIRTFQHSENNTQQNHLDEYQTNYRTMSEQHSRKGKSPTVERIRQRCGKIFKRQQIIFNNREPKESTYFKWCPLVEQNQEKPVYLNGPSLKRQNPLQKAKKSISSYRAKQRILKNLTTIQFNQNSNVQQSNQIKQQGKFTMVSAFKLNVADWQIKNISDNFRYKILKKLQIPSSFPLGPPSPQCSIEEYQTLSQKVYEMFGVQLYNIENPPIIRKFKNGIYFQLEPDRNVVWYFSGVFYFGNWQTDLPSEGQKNGFGFQYVPNKYIYLGYFKSGTRHGHGVIKVFPSNKEQQNQFMGYDGQWLNGKPHGYGKQIDQLNTKYIGDFDSGEKTGHAIILSKEGIYYEGQVYKGLKQGTGMQRLANGDSYNGQFYQGKINGKGVYKWKNGSSYEGEFVNGLREGKGYWKSFNGDQFEGQYFQDVKHGWGKFKWVNGQIYEGYFKNDNRQGQGTYKHPSGKIGKFLWQNGKIVHRLYCKEEEKYRCRLIKQKHINSQA